MAFDEVVPDRRGPKGEGNNCGPAVGGGPRRMSSLQEVQDICSTLDGGAFGSVFIEAGGSRFV